MYIAHVAGMGVPHANLPVIFLAILDKQTAKSKEPVINRYFKYALCNAHCTIFQYI